MTVKVNFPNGTDPRKGKERNSRRANLKRDARDGKGGGRVNRNALTASLRG